MNQFVGRTRELEVLRRQWSRPGGAFVPVYGRRRIGKSELLLRFLESHPGVYFLGKQAPAGLQLREFLEVAAQALEQPLLGQLAPAGWKQALQAVVGAWRGPGKLVLVLDEFQWMVEGSPELPSVLQELWDREWRDLDRVMLVLCGSYVGFMEREVLGSKSPLFGRRTAQIQLQPFSFRDARAFHPDYSLVDAAKTWMICGGVPMYLRTFDPQASVECNVRDQLLDEFAPLHREPEFLLREELREVHSYYALLMALAEGPATVATLARQAALPERNLPYYLERLASLGYVGRRWPLTTASPHRLHVRYVLDDPLLLFWFRFVWPELSTLARLGPERAFERRVRPHLDAWFGAGFERLCREALPLLLEEEGARCAVEVGSYWSKEVQIDLVGLRDDGRIELGECKWGGADAPAALVEGLRARAARYPNTQGATIGLRVFTRRRPAGAARAEGVRWHGLEELYGEG